MKPLEVRVGQLEATAAAVPQCSEAALRRVGEAFDQLSSAAWRAYLATADPADWEATSAKGARPGELTELELLSIALGPECDPYAWLADFGERVGERYAPEVASLWCRWQAEDVASTR